MVFNGKVVSIRFLERDMAVSTSAANSDGSAEPSAVDADWAREASRRWWDPSRRLLRSLRDYDRAVMRGGAAGWLEAKAAVLRHRFWSVVTGADIPVNTNAIGGGLLMPHPNGVVVHPDVEIGPNCTLFQQVTLGTGPKPGVPRLGGHVDVGPGARVLGGVVIGEGAVIGANSVVLSDIPPGGVAVGIPAVVVRTRPLGGGDGAGSAVDSKDGGEGGDGGDDAGDRVDPMDGAGDQALH